MRADSYFIDVPDARLPIITQCAPSGRGTLRLYEQSRRRALVLAAARQRLAELGHEKLTLRMLASDCDVAVQTIFNLIGNRPQVIRDCLNDLGGLIDVTARNSTQHPFYPVAFADTIWHLTRVSGDCMRRLSLALFRVDPTITRDVHKFGSMIVRRSLSEMQDKLRPGVDTMAVADAVASITNTATHEWAIGTCDLAEFRFNIVSRVSLVLTGALKPSEADAMYSYLESFQRHHSFYRN